MIEFVRGRVHAQGWRFLAALLLLVGALGPAQDATAQSPSAAEVEAFKNLPPSSSRPILEEMGAARRAACVATRI